MANFFSPEEINCQVIVNRPLHGFSTFDREQLAKIPQHRWKEFLTLKLPSLKVIC